MPDHRSVPADAFTLDTPGDILMTELVVRKGVSQDLLAQRLGVSRVTVNQILNDRRNITAEMALRLSQVLGTSPEFWLNLQRDLDLHRARLSLGDTLERLTPLEPPSDGPPLASKASLFGAS